MSALSCVVAWQVKAMEGHASTQDLFRRSRSFQAQKSNVRSWKLAQQARAHLIPEVAFPRVMVRCFRSLFNHLYFENVVRMLPPTAAAQASMSI